MYSPYSSSTQRNKSRLYLFLFLTFLALIIYWRYSSSQKRTFQSAGENIDSIVEQGKDKINDINEKAADLVDATKDKAKKIVDNIEQVAADVKKKL
jgi:predicted negative regulator of RcsB-dependent stress response